MDQALAAARAAAPSLSIIPDNIDEVWREDPAALAEIDEHLERAGGNGNGGRPKRRPWWVINDDHPPTINSTLNSTTNISNNPTTNILKKKKKPPQRDSGLPQRLAARLGEATVAYARGDLPAAAAALHDVIRQAPAAHAPWATLALVHAADNDAQRSLAAGLVAAHLRPSDAQTWRHLADHSLAANLRDQALYCLNRALRADPDDINARWVRAEVLRDAGRLELAISELRAILAIAPDSPVVAKELARIYLRLSLVPHAIRLFEDLIDADQAAPLIPDPSAIPNDPPPMRMGLEELNMLAELYIDVGDHDKAIAAIKFGLARLHRIPTIAVNLDSDAEFDPVAPSDPSISSSGLPSPNNREIPLELRTKLGICRLRLGDTETARMHFAVLFDCNLDTYAELVLDVAEAHMSARKFGAALEVLNVLAQNPSTNVPAVWSRVAKCHHALGDDNAAIRFYSDAIALQPHDENLRLALAAIYEDIGAHDRAVELFRDARTANARPDPHDRVADRTPHSSDTPTRYTRSSARLRLQRDAANQDPSTTDPTNLAPVSENQALLILQDEAMRRQQRIAKDRMLVRALEETRASENAQDYTTFQKIVDIPHSRQSARQHANLHRTARRLMAKFQSNNCFFYEKSMLRKIRKQRREQMELGLDANNNNATAAQNGSRYPDDDEADIAPDEIAITDDIVMDGLSLRDWRQLFVRYALLTIQEGLDDDANAALETLNEAVIGRDSRDHIRILMLIIAVYSRNYKRAAEICRWFMLETRCCNDSIRLYLAAFSSGVVAAAAFATNSNQKFFARSLRAVKTLVHSVISNGSANNTTTDSRGDIVSSNAPVHLYMILGHIMCCTRSYITAIESYYIEAYKHAPTDPLVNLCLANAHLHRSHQRLCISKHWHVVQGVTFLMQYGELRGECCESWFNVARGFHSVGLVHLALPYYQKVLQSDVGGGDGEGDSRDGFLRFVAAHNVALVYVASGSTALAQRVVSRYCWLD